MPFNVGGYIYNGQMGFNQRFKSVITNGLILQLDASSVTSYGGSGSTWTDLSGQGVNGTINGVSWVSDGLKSYFNFPTVSDNNYISTATSQTYLDFTFVFQPDFTASGLVGLIGSSAPGTAADKSLRFSADGSNAWTITSRNPGDVNDWAYGPYIKSKSATNWLGSKKEDQSFIKSVSPIHWVKKTSPPVFIVHGDADPTVPYQESVALHAALVAAGVKTEFITIPGGLHGKFDKDQNTMLNTAIFKFIESLEAFKK